MSRSDLINPPRMLPDVTLPDAEGVARRVRASGDRSVLLVLVHEGCGDCRAWLAALAVQRDEIAAWKGEVKVIAPLGDEGPFPLLVDADAKLASALGIAAPAVVIADQWGEIHEAAEAGEEHAFLPVESIVQWVSHLATQCPECEGEAL